MFYFILYFFVHLPSVTLQSPLPIAMFPLQALATAVLLAGHTLADKFTISNGQIFTPGFVVLDAPQPGTPLGGGK